MQLQDELDECLDISRGGAHSAAISMPSPLLSHTVLTQHGLDNDDQIATNERIDRLLRAQGDSAAATADKIAELDAKTQKARRTRTHARTHPPTHPPTPPRARAHTHTHTHRYVSVCVNACT
jgi:hypothetical protein